MSYDGNGMWVIMAPCISDFGLGPDIVDCHKWFFSCFVGSSIGEFDVFDIETDGRDCCDDFTDFCFIK